MSNFEAEVPERIEDLVNELLELFAELMGRAGEKAEKVEIGAGVEEPPAVASIGNEGNLGLAVVFGQRKGKKSLHHVIDERGTEGGIFQPSESLEVEAFEA